MLQWIHGLILEIVEFAATELLGVFSMDLAFFESAIPVTHDIFNIVIASGWALLLGNLVFQAAKSMMSGIGFEADDPRELFTRTFVFAFLLLASRQICEIGLGLSGSLIDLLEVPDAVNVGMINEDAFGIGASWLLVIIFSFVIMWQLVKLFLEVGERYFLVGLLTILAPWAFAMGGSKSTADIFKGWVRMFASMCLMMVLNVVILKLMLSAISSLPSGIECVPWMLLIVGIARVGRKIDNVIMKIGLNPALTGDGMGKGLPGMLSYMVIRSAASKVLNTAGGAKSTANNGGATNRSTTRNTANASTASSSKRASTANSTSRGNSNSQSSANVSSRNTQGGTSVHSPNVTTTASKYDTSVSTTANGQSSVSSRNIDTKNSVHSPAQANATHQTGVTSRNAQAHNSTQNTINSGTAGTPPLGGISARGSTPNPVSTSGGTAPQSKSGVPNQARYSSVPSGAKPPLANRNKPSTIGSAGIGNAGNTHATNSTLVSNRDSSSPHAAVHNSDNSSINLATSRQPGNAGTATPKNSTPLPSTPAAPNPMPSSATRENAPISRDTSRQSPKPTNGIAGTPSAGSAPKGVSQTTAQPKSTVGNAGTPQNAAHPTSRPPSSDPRHRGNAAPPSASAQPASTSPRAASQESNSQSRDTSRQTRQPTSGIAGTPPNITSNAVKPANPYKPRQPNLGKGGSAKNTAKNVTEKRKNSKFRRGGNEDGE